MQTQEYMHTVAGVAHLDISSNNLMICSVEPEMKLRIFDLGCAEFFPPGMLALQNTCTAMYRPALTFSGQSSLQTS